MKAEAISTDEGGLPRRRHRHRRRLSPPRATLAFAAVTGVLALTVALGIAAPGALVGAPLLSNSHAQLADRALRISPVDYALASRQNDAALAASPLDAEAWVRRAYIARQQSSILNNAAMADLERSYKAAPLGPDITRWRLRFMFEHWTELSPRLRDRAIAELENFVRFNTGSAQYISAIQSPRGRLAAYLISRKVYREANQKAGTNPAR